ncbi:MAG: ribosome-associated translation inhibitor RaiA [Candidatus Margulisiibacteriota bacterium]
MPIIVQGHGTHLTPALRSYAFKKFEKLPQFFENIQKIEIILDARTTADSSRSQVAEVTVWAAGKKVIRATEAGQDMYAAIDLVYEEIKSQIKKHKEKHRDERRRTASLNHRHGEISRRGNGRATAPQIVSIRHFLDKPMRHEEALEEFNLAQQDFMLYKTTHRGEVNLICIKNRKPSVVEINKLKSLSPEQAAKELSKGKKLFYPFLNNSTNVTNVIYKRKSGNFGLVEPGF